MHFSLLTVRSVVASMGFGDGHMSTSDILERGWGDDSTLSGAKLAPNASTSSRLGTTSIALIVAGVAIVTLTVGLAIGCFTYRARAKVACLCPEQTSACCSSATNKRKRAHENSREHSTCALQSRRQTGAILWCRQGILLVLPFLKQR